MKFVWLGAMNRKKLKKTLWIIYFKIIAATTYTYILIAFMSAAIKCHTNALVQKHLIPPLQNLFAFNLHTRNFQTKTSPTYNQWEKSTKRAWLWRQISDATTTKKYFYSFVRIIINSTNKLQATNFKLTNTRTANGQWKIDVRNTSQI